MSDITADFAPPAPRAARAALRVDVPGGAGSVQDYFLLLKPRVMSLVIFTAFAGMVVAPGSVHPWLAFMALLCISIGAGAAGVLNMWYDADIDAVMARTALRPVPRGKVLPGEALAFGLTLSAGSVIMLGVLVDWVAAAFLAFTIFFYAVIYTMWLKRSTVQNIVIGGAAGAFPPMIGWTAVTGTIDWQSVTLFLIIFLWTPPHFWALALFRTGEYARAGVPMMPVVRGIAETRRQILLYAIAMVPVAVSPWLVGISGLVYLAAALPLSLAFLWYAVAVYRDTEGQNANRAAKKLFGYSILYLFAIFAALIVDRIAQMPAVHRLVGLA
ncbi:MAG: heme o synthase [Hyphomicrobiales bacterium]